MTARPLDTFASEGWYRPTHARAEHYFRPRPDDPARMGEYAVYSLCETYADGGGSRRFLTANPRLRTCIQCSSMLSRELLREDGGWFERETTR